jgi:excinuclease ABC subunit C
MTTSLIKRSIAIIKTALLNMPNKPGVYRMLDKNGKILYIGKAKDLAKRISNYTQINRLCERMRLAISQTESLEIITANSEAQALVLEASLIKSLKPKYNILLKDDKSMPYILLRQDHEFGQLLKYRGEKNIKGQYFGPFASPKIVEQTIEFLEKNFLLRNCSDYFFAGRKSACMQYQIKRCSAPCVKKISEVDYQHNMKMALDFLRGKNASLQKEISLLMRQASDDMEYEKAGKYRDQLKALNYIQNKNVNLFDLEDADVIGIAKQGDLACVQLFLFRNGQNYGNRCFFFDKVSDETEEKILSLFLAQLYHNNPIAKETIVLVKPEDAQNLIQGFEVNLVIPKSGSKFKAAKFVYDNANEAINRRYTEKQQTKILLEEVQQLFNISSPIKRIEVYDNSHIMGAHAIGAMIVSTEEGFSKKHYRKYNIQAVEIGDDYAMLREVLTRRLSKLENDIPDLLLIDGGEGHLTVAMQVLKELEVNIPLVCIAKGAERNAGKEVFYQIAKQPFTLDKNKMVMKYLQILRDEAHRFAITTHRAKRKMAMGFSILNQIPGVGSKRRKVLINHFTSIEEIKDATIEQLTKLDGINKRIAEEIDKFFKSK